MRRTLVIAALVISASVLVLPAAGGGEGAFGPAPNDGSSSVADLPVIEVSARWASANGRDLATLIDTTGFVFLGRVAALSGQRYEEMAPGGAAQGAGPPPFPISLFTVEVRRSLLGGLSQGTTITVEQAGGVSKGADGRQVMLRLESSDLLQVGSTYLFFAEPSPRGNGNYVVPPWGRFEVDPNRRLAAPAAWAGLGAVREVAGMTVAGVFLESGAGGGR